MTEDSKVKRSIYIIGGISLSCSVSLAVSQVSGDTPRRG